VNAGYLRIVVLTQYKSHSLDRHITTTWRMSTLLGNYVTPVPAQQRLGPQWFSGSADAIHQSLNLVYDEQPEHVVVFGADHVYRMDAEQMVQQHIASGAGVTVAGIRIPRSEAKGFGIIQTADGRTIDAFLEKPDAPPGLPDDPETVYASMGNYVFTTEALLEAVKLDAGDEGSVHDMGGNIIPMLVEKGAAEVYDFNDNDVPGSTERDQHYWRDVGTLDAYYDAHMDLISVHPIFNMYNHDWPIHTWPGITQPAKFVLWEPGRVGTAIDSLVSQGVIVSGGSVR
jgi:glucose-1-phosphate adenylyltransferase